MMPFIRKSKKGVSLVEIMIAVIISTIVMLGGSFFFVSSTNQINLRRQYRVASQLASQKIEELKAVDYDTVAIGVVEDSVTLKNSSYSRSVLVQDLGSYKEITVNINWGPAGQMHDVSLVTLIAPK
jgi:prepilin-type N-terminal cleavage/methylation domain-containing protein